MGASSAKPQFGCSSSCMDANPERRPTAWPGMQPGMRPSPRSRAGSLECEEDDEEFAPAEEEECEEDDPRESAREWLKCQENLGSCTCDLHEELLKADEEWLIDLHCEEMMNDEDLCLSTDYFNYLIGSVENLFPKVEPPEPWTGFAEKLRECYAAHACEQVDKRGRGGPLMCREVAQMYQQFVCSDFSRRVERQRKGEQRAERSERLDRSQRSQDVSSCGLSLPQKFDGGYD